MAIATSDDVQDRLTRTLSSKEQDVADAMIGDFTGDLEAFLGRPLEPGTFTETRYLRRDDVMVALDKTPVATVSSVVVNGTVIDPAAYEITTGGLIFLAFLPVDLVAYTGEAAVVVTYTTAIEARRLKPAFNAVVWRTVRALTKTKDETEGISQLAIEDYKVVYQDDGFTQGEIDACSRLRRRVVA